MTDQPFAPSFDPPAPQPPRPTHHHFDILGSGTGTIYRDPPPRPVGWGPDDGSWYTPEARPGFHANTTPDYLAGHPELEPFVVNPVRLRQGWQDGETVAMRFADRAEFLAVAGDGAVPPEPVAVGPLDLG